MSIQLDRGATRNNLSIGTSALTLFSTGVCHVVRLAVYTNWTVPLGLKPLKLFCTSRSNSHTLVAFLALCLSCGPSLCGWTNIPCDLLYQNTEDGPALAEVLTDLAHLKMLSFVGFVVLLFIRAEIHLVYQLNMVDCFYPIQAKNIRNLDWNFNNCLG